jgi:SAM-dependent methyltransferase
MDALRFFDREDVMVALRDDESCDIWDENAGEWDARMQDGTPLFGEQIWPATARLLELARGQRVLDVACGNGVAARRMADLGVQVVACDLSPRMIERARARGDGQARIEYHVVDARNAGELLALRGGSRDEGDRHFDAVHAGMALFDIEDVEPLFRAMTGLLRPGGRFVFSLLHPCFNNPSRTVSSLGTGASSTRITGVFVHRYLAAYSHLGVAMPGLRPHPTFHRSLQEMLGYGFANGLALTGLVEPAAAPANGTPAHPMGEEIPAVLVLRMAAFDKP